MGNPSEELPGSDFVRQAEDEEALERAHTLSVVDAAFAPYDARVAAAKAEEIGKAAKVIYEAVNGTDEERRVIIEKTQRKED